MTAKEAISLRQISEKLNALIEVQERHNNEQKEMAKDIASIKLGLYGDSVNNHKGVISELADREVRISANEQFRKKFVWLLIGANFVFTASIIIITELLR